ncbi:MAG: hypothetical protein IPK28_17845 [Devosia sp.]|nr:hypothetical protein [Devosia sp.]
MLSQAEAAAMLPPTFQILTGLSFAAILAIRFLAGSMLRPLWGKLLAFSVLLVALGNLLMSMATAKSTMSGGAEFFTLAGISLLRRRASRRRGAHHRSAQQCRG